MGYVRETVYIHAPIERVWEFVTDYKRFPDWQTNVFEVKDIFGTPGTVGFAYTAFFKALGQKMEGKFKIVKAERPRFIEEEGLIVGGGKMLTTTVFESTPEGFAAVTFTVDYDLGLSITGPERLIFEHSLERGLRFANETLKELIELPVPVLA